MRQLITFCLLGFILAACGSNQSAQAGATATQSTEIAAAPSTPTRQAPKPPTATPPPTAVPPTAVPPTAAPSPTVVPPTAVPPPPTAVPPTAVPPPPTAIPPTAAPPTAVPPTPTAIPPTAVPPPPTEAPAIIVSTEVPAPPTEAPPPPVQLAYFFPVRPAGGVSYGSCHHDYPASDMFTPSGSSFVAVTSGVVDWVSYEDVWDPANDNPAVRGGRSVAIVGDDGVRYYGSHLLQVADGIAPGGRVEAGQLLGLTGKSGDAVNTPPHLHFGISHPTTPDDWSVRRGEINPVRYLNAWRRGEQITPDLSVVGGGAC